MPYIARKEKINSFIRGSVRLRMKLIEAKASYLKMVNLEGEEDL